MDDVVFSDIEKFLKMTKKRGGFVISIMAKLHPNFETYLNTEIGREILKRDLERIEELLMKIWNETSTEAERAEFRNLKIRLEEITGKISLYLKNVKMIKKAVA